MRNHGEGVSGSNLGRTQSHPLAESVCFLSNGSQYCLNMDVKQRQKNIKQAVKIKYYNLKPIYNQYCQQETSATYCKEDIYRSPKQGGQMNDWRDFRKKSPLFSYNFHIFLDFGRDKNIK